MVAAQCGQNCAKAEGHTVEQVETPWKGAVTKQDIADNPQYYSHFTDGQLRLDLTFAGNAQKQDIYLSGLKEEPLWAGSRRNMIPDFVYGEYRMEVRDFADNKLLYATGFNTLFQEWRTTEEALNTSKAFNSSYRIPFPKHKVNVIFYERLRKDGSYSKLAGFTVDPEDKLINREQENSFAVTPIINNGHPQNKVDIVFIAEGYTSDQMEKFRNDVKRHVGYLFDIEPYKSRKEDFNIWAVESVSLESGTDIPHHDIWKKTCANSNFYTFRSDRYLTAENQTLVCKLCSNAPCDAMYVIVNTEKYGGGGIYNFYGLGMSDHRTTPMVFVHEFGHSFAGLADEYFYDSDETFFEMYNTAVEPWEPNITSLVEFEKKWKDMLEAGTPVPTRPEEGKPLKLGVYEGAGYMTKGLYRPVDNCRMRTNEAPGFCPVCQRAIGRMIDFFTK
ncbi:MAG: peptidase M64 [Bacteroidales bacterium]|nr:peptidase M64 [Bacteroidales bacterium]